MTDNELTINLFVIYTYARKHFNFHICTFSGYHSIDSFLPFIFLSFLYIDKKKDEKKKLFAKKLDKSHTSLIQTPYVKHGLFYENINSHRCHENITFLHRYEFSSDKDLSINYHYYYYYANVTNFMSITISNSFEMLSSIS